MQNCDAIQLPPEQPSSVTFSEQALVLPDPEVVILETATPEALVVLENGISSTVRGVNRLQSIREMVLIPASTH